MYLYLFFVNLSLVDAIQNLFLNYIGFSLSNIGILLTILIVGKIIFEIPTGYIADRFGNKVSLLVALFMKIIAIFILYNFKNIVVIALYFIITAISYTLTTGCYDTILVNVSNKQDKYDLKLVNAISRTIYYISLGLTSIIAGYISDTNFYTVFVLNIIFLVLSILVLMLVDDDIKDEKQNIPTSFNAIDIVNHIKSNRILSYFILIECAINFSMIPIDEFYSLYLLKVFDLDYTIVIYIKGFQYIFISIMAIFLTKYLKGDNNRIIIVGMPIMMFLAFTCFCISKIYYLAIFFYISGIIIFYIYAPYKYSMLHNTIENKYRTTIISYKAAITMILSCITQPLIGVLSDIISMRCASIILIGISLMMLLLINILYNDIFVSEANNKLSV